MREGLHCPLRGSRCGGISSDVECHKHNTAYSRKSSPICTVSDWVAPARAHAARKMDIDGFSTRSVSLMSTGERYSNIPRSRRTSSARIVNAQPRYMMIQQRTYSHICIGDETRPHAHCTECTNCNPRISAVATLNPRGKDPRVGRVSSKRQYPSRELNRFMRLGTIVPRCFSTAPGSAPAPMAVRETTSPHHFVAPPSYDGFSACSCRSADERLFKPQFDYRERGKKSTPSLNELEMASGGSVPR
jgi:hypothetical protein